MTDYCLLCAEIKSNSDLISIITDENLNLYEKISKCLQITIDENDKLPKLICSECCKNLFFTYEFYEKVHNAYIFLQRKFYQPEYEQIKTEPDEKLNNDTLEVSVKLEENSSENVNENLYNNFKTSPCSDENEVVQQKRERISKISKNKINKNTDVDSSKLKFRIKLNEIREGWKNYQWKCNICSLDLISVNDLRTHYKNKHQTSPRYNCTECLKVYANYKYFRAHISAHRNKDQFYCKTCGKYSKTKYLHNYHISTHSKFQQNFKCTICNKTFKTSAYLNLHKRYTHYSLCDAKNYKFECNICHKKCINLTIHKKIHTDLPENICEYCGVTFKLQSNLTQHILRKHKDTVYYCTMCSKTFKSIYGLKKHQEVHVDNQIYKCEKCQKEFRHKRSLRRHEQLHTGQLLKHECELCQKCFSRKSYLKKHLRQHTGETPYYCRECDHHFSYNSNFIKHLKGRHGLKNVSIVNHHQYPFTC